MPHAHPEPADPGPPQQHGARSVAARRRAVWGLGWAIATALLLTVAVGLDGAILSGFDDSITSFTRSWADGLGWPVDVAHWIGLITAPRWSTVAAAVVVVALFLTRQRAAAALLAGSAILGVALTELAKRTVGRMRPPGAEQFEPDLDRSFPSGHSSAGIYLYLATGMILLQLARHRGDRALAGVGWTLVVFGPLLGLTRLVLGVHWPSDVLAGWAFGSIGLLTSAVLLWWALDAGWRGTVRTSQAEVPPGPSGA